jgi:hypothetical protein
MTAAARHETHAHVEPRRRCAGCLALQSARACPCGACGRCTSDGGLTGPGCGCGREPLGADGPKVELEVELAPGPEASS